MISFTSFKKTQLYRPVICLLIHPGLVIHPVIWCFPIWLTSSLSYLMAIFSANEIRTFLFSCACPHKKASAHPEFWHYSSNCDGEKCHFFMSYVRINWRRYKKWFHGFLFIPKKTQIYEHNCSGSDIKDPPDSTNMTNCVQI